MGWTREQVVKVARRTGYPVVEAWSGHNRGTMGTVMGPMLHHTGSPGATGDYPTLRVVRDGRAGLENSLSMYGLGRSGTIYCISEKVSWHAGTGAWNGITDGNGRFAGIEAESSGNGVDWTPAQLDAYKRLVASILMECGRDVNWAVAHKEWALPKGRKPDPAGIDMGQFRAAVQHLLNNQHLLNKIGDEEDVSLLNEPINFVNPDTGKMTTFTVAQHIAWTNYYAGKLFLALSGGTPAIAQAVWASPQAQNLDAIKQAVVAAVSESQNTAVQEDAETIANLVLAKLGEKISKPEV